MDARREQGQQRPQAQITRGHLNEASFIDRSGERALGVASSC